jgi:hypothetical protein
LFSHHTEKRIHLSELIKDREKEKEEEEGEEKNNI